MAKKADVLAQVEDEVMVVDYTPKAIGETQELKKPKKVKISEEIDSLVELDADDISVDDIFDDIVEEDVSSDDVADDEEISEQEIEHNLEIDDLEVEFSIPVKCYPVRIEEIIKKRKVQRTNLFYEINEVEERVNKKKYSETKAPEYPTRAKRSKEHKQEESPEELIARIARELDDDRSLTIKHGMSQLCTKCGIMPVEDQFRIDRNLGYCEDCADILQLGQSKEARGLFTAEEDTSTDDDDDAAI